MSARAKAHAEKLDRLMEEASAALVATQYFHAERLAAEALSLAHQSRDFERMARIVMPLQEARRLRRQQAADSKKLTRIDNYPAFEALMTGTEPLKPGCYLIEPPLVGADARELREKGLHDEVPVIVLAREPETQMGLWPVVTVGPLTVRARIEPPGAKKIALSWFLKAFEALGDAAIAQIDPEEAAEDRVEHAMDLLAAVVDHEKLHQTLRAACEEAHRDAIDDAARPRKGRKPALGEDGEPLDDDDDIVEE